MRPSEIAKLPEVEVRSWFTRLMATPEGTGPEDAALLLQMREDEMADWLLGSYDVLRQALLSDNATLSGAAWAMLVRHMTLESAAVLLEHMQKHGDRVVAQTLANARTNLRELIAPTGLLAAAPATRGAAVR